MPHIQLIFVLTGLSEIVKPSDQVVADSLTIIFNHCINLMKSAKVIPIHKGDSILSVSNYRTHISTTHI